MIILLRETENEIKKMDKIKDDFKIAQDMTSLKALHLEKE